MFKNVVITQRDYFCKMKNHLNQRTKPGEISLKNVFFQFKYQLRKLICQYFEKACCVKWYIKKILL